VAWWRSRGAARLEYWLDADRAEDRLPGHPAIRTSWFEAMAFCRWLTLRWQRAELLALDLDIRLPTEVLWERAARGPQRPGQPAHRRWPWGDEWCVGIANTSEAGLGTTTAVGLFPDGSAEKVRDLAGNCWEWTATRWGADCGNPAYYWPLDPGDGRNDPGGEDLRIIRGGTYFLAPRDCRCAYRFGLIPLDWTINLGFRVSRVSLANPVF
jgi:iron(II)-dependent oxidoreductase